MAANTAHHPLRKPAHRRAPSDELDVFEAARYLSGCNDTIGFSDKPLTTNIPSGTALTGRKQGMFEGEHHMPSKHGDYPKTGTVRITADHGIDTKGRAETECKKKQPKHPVTPRARLAGFLSSLFLQSGQQSASRTKATFSAPERERRRNNVGNIQKTSQVVVGPQPKSPYSSKSTGTRTPPHPNQKKSFGSSKSVASYPTGDDKCRRIKELADVSWANERFRGVGELQWEKNRAVAENIRRVHVGELLQGDNWAGLPPLREKKWTLNKDSKGLIALRGDGPLGDLDFSKKKRQIFWRREEAEDGDAESDSSSDLFELHTNDVGVGEVSGRLPEYKTTAAK